MQKQMANEEVDGKIQLLIDAIVAVRNIRSEWNIGPSVRADILIKTKIDKIAIFNDNLVYIRNLARVENITVKEELKKPARSATAVIKDTEIYVPLEQYIDLKGEKERLGKKIKEIEGRIKMIDAKLENENFVKRAPAAVVESEKSKKRNNNRGNETGKEKKKKMDELKKKHQGWKKT